MKPLEKGAVWGLAFALVYGALFCLYAAVRLSVALTETAHPPGTWIAVITSLAVSCFTIALVMGIVAAMMGAAAFGLAGWITKKTGAGPWIGLAVPAAILLFLHLWLREPLRPFWPAFYPLGYWFWVGGPALIFIAATLLEMSAFHRSSKPKTS
jgi:hypothetical protein